MTSDPTATDTGELLTALAAGSADAGLELYDRFADRIHDLALFVTRDPAVAAEVTRDVVVMAAGAAPALDDPEALRAWMYAHTRSETFALLGARGRTPAEDRVVELPDLPDDHASADLAGLVYQATAAFGERDLALIALHLRHRLDGEDLADAMGVSTGAVQVLLPATLERAEAHIRVLLALATDAPCCPTLAELAATWDGSFSPRVRTRAPVHAADCAEALAVLPSPLSLLQGIPLVPAPPGLRDAVEERLHLTGGMTAGGAAVGEPGDRDARRSSASGAHGVPDPSLDDTLPPVGAAPVAAPTFGDDATIPPGLGPTPVLPSDPPSPAPPSEPPPDVDASPAAQVAAAPLHESPADVLEQAVPSGEPVSQSSTGTVTRARRIHRMPVPLALALGVAIGLVVAAGLFRAVIDAPASDATNPPVVLSAPPVADPSADVAGTSGSAAAVEPPVTDVDEVGVIQVGSRDLALGGCGPDRTEVAVVVTDSQTVDQVVVTTTGPGPASVAQVALSPDDGQAGRFVGVLGPFAAPGEVSLAVAAQDAQGGAAAADAGWLSVAACSSQQ